MIYSSISTHTTNRFKDRYEAGELLADKLTNVVDDDAILLALPRGGVPVGFQVAKKLKIPLSVIVSRKIGAPGQEEFGIGAIAEENSLHLDQNIISSLNIETDAITKIIDREKAELRRRIKVYRENKPLPDLKDKTVILVDDGLATGVTAKAALEAVKKLGVENIVFAAPVCAKQSIDEIKELVDEVICLMTPKNMRAIGLYFEEFGQTTDDEVITLINKAEKINGESN